jgi:acyl carrier protein
LDLSAIRTFINTELLNRKDQRIDDAADLIETRVIDSVMLLRLTLFLEEHYGIEIPDEDIGGANFRSLGSIEAFVTRHMKKAQPSKDNSL